MARSLPRRPSFSSLQKQAKKLLRLFRQNDAEAASRVRQHHPRPDAFSGPCVTRSSSSPANTAPGTGARYGRTSTMPSSRS